jgi:hypothetical protein
MGQLGVMFGLFGGVGAVGGGGGVGGAGLVHEDVLVGQIWGIT